MSKKLFNEESIRRKLEKNEKAIQKMIRTDIEPDILYSVELPNIYKTKDGRWEFEDSLTDISTLAEFNEYARQNEELYQIIKEHYPSIISTIWHAAYSKFYGSTSVASKVLHGGAVDLDKIITKSAENEYFYEQPTIQYILTKVNGDKAKNNPVKIKPYKKTKKQVMDMLAAGEGYYLPVITENGALVQATKGKRLCVEFFAVGKDEYTEAQIKEYLLANADASLSNKEENMHECEDIVEEMMVVAKEAFSAAMNDEFETLRRSVEQMNITCSFLYRPDFSLLEDKKVKVETEYLSDVEENAPTTYFDGEQLKLDLGDDEPKTKETYIERIVVEGDTNSHTKFDKEKGKVVLTLTPDGQLGYRVEFADDGKTLVAVPVEQQMQ